MRSVRTFQRLFALACLFLGGLGLFALLARVALLGWFGTAAPWTNTLTAPDPVWAWIVDLALLALFAAQHSGMARHGFQFWLERFFPAHLTRALYVGASGLVALAMALAWQPLPGETLWEGSAWIASVAFAALAAAVMCGFHFDANAFLGWEQARTQRKDGVETLYIEGPYRFLRHPLMLCVLVFLWAQPVMTPTLALLSGGLSLYILAALPLEERDLVRTFGSAYGEYRKQVPALWPRWPPVPARRVEVR